MMKTNLASLIAVAAGAFAGDVAPRQHMSRTVKVRPKNYTHTMITSSRTEIREHNAKVEATKRDRDERRLYERRKLLGNTAILQLVPARHRNRGNTAYLNRAYKRMTFALGI